MPDREAELRLVSRLIDRDRTAWNDFVQQYERLVFARVVRTASECQWRLAEADTEDLCAEVFARLIAHDCAALRRFEARSSIGTWLAVIARRVTLEYVRRNRSRRRHGWGIGLEEGSPADERPDPLRELIEREDRSLLTTMMLRLREGDRKILTMYYLDRLGYGEISNRLSISVNTVGPKLHRAQQRLRRLLDGTGNDGS